MLSSPFVTFITVIIVPFLKCLSTSFVAENTQKVAKNLDYNNIEADAELSKSHVDVLVPEILQVISYECYRIGTSAVRRTWMSLFPTS